MKESFKKNWIYYLAAFFLVLGLFYYSKAYAYDHFAYDNRGEVYCFQHPLAIKHMDMLVDKPNINLSYCRALALENCFTNASC